MHKLGIFSKLAASSLIGMGLLALIGWRFDCPFLVSWAPGFPAINPLSAVCLVLNGLSLWILHTEACSSRRRAVAQCLALIVLVMGALRVATSADSNAWAPDLILFHRDVVADLISNRMSVYSALSFIGCGFALLALDNKLGKAWYPSQTIVIVVGLNGLLVLTTYSASLPFSLVRGSETMMSMPSACCFIVFALALLASRPQHGFMSLLSANSFGSTLIRRLTFVAIVVPIFFGLIAIDGVRTELLKPQEAIDGLIVTVMVFLISSIILAAKALRKSALEREVAESAVQRHQAFLHDVINTIPNFIFVKDWDGRFVLANTSTAEVYGTTVEDLVGKSDADYCSDPEELAYFLEKDRETMLTGHEVVIPAEKITDSQGNVRWLKTIKRPIRCLEGDHPNVLGVSADITEIKRIEAELLASQAELSKARDELEEQNSMLERLVRERTRALELSQAEMLKRLAIASEFRDDDTGEHTNRVSELSGLLAEVLGLPEREVELIRAAAALHDLGKIGISDRVFLKPGKLTADEYEIMKTHTVIASKILGGSPSPMLQMAETIALTHHEKWDGTGYPHGLQREEIPLAGRIVAVADVFDALTHARPYKHAWEINDAVREIRRLSGTHFDPQVVDAFLRLMDAEFEEESREAA